MRLPGRRAYGSRLGLSFGPQRSSVAIRYTYVYACSCSQRKVVGYRPVPYGAALVYCDLELAAADASPRPADG